MFFLYHLMGEAFYHLWWTRKVLVTRIGAPKYQYPSAQILARGMHEEQKLCVLIILMLGIRTKPTIRGPSGLGIARRDHNLATSKQMTIHGECAGAQEADSNCSCDQE